MRRASNVPPPPRVPLCPCSALSDEILGLYESVKLKKAFKYFIFALKETGKVGVTTTYDWEIVHKADAVADSENKAAFDDMVKRCNADKPQFIVFDFADTKADGRQIKKLVLIKWVPESTHFRVKPVYGASYQVRARDYMGADVGVGLQKRRRVLGGQASETAPPLLVFHVMPPAALKLMLML